MEDRLIVEAMERADRSQKRAAELLGLTYDQFRHYYRKHRDTHRKTNEPKNSQPES